MSKKTVQLTVNGEPYRHAGVGALASVLDKMGADAERVATVVNDEIVTRAARAAVRLKDGDRLEILTFAGGG